MLKINVKFSVFYLYVKCMFISFIKKIIMCILLEVLEERAEQLIQEKNGVRFVIYTEELKSSKAFESLGLSRRELKKDKRVVSVTFDDCMIHIELCNKFFKTIESKFKSFEY